MSMSQISSARFIEDAFNERRYKEICENCRTRDPSELLPINAARVGWSFLKEYDYDLAKKFIDSAVKRNRYFISNLEVSDLDTDMGAVRKVFPDWSWPNLVLAQHSRKNQDIHSAYMYILNSSLSRDHPSEAAHAFEFTNICMALWNSEKIRAVDKIKKILEADFSRFGERGWNLLQQGILLQCMDQKEDAFLSFKKITSEETSYNKVLAGANTLFDPSNIIKYNNPVTLLEEDIVGRPDICIMASADKDYLIKFSDVYINSAKYCEAASFHFCVMNPTIDSKKIINNLRKITGKTINASYYKIIGIDQDKLKSAYACSRFLIYEDMLRIYNRGVLVTDIDAAFRPGLSEFINGLGEADIGLRFIDAPYRLPWQTAVAGAVWIANTAVARRFLASVAEYCCYGLLDPSVRGVPSWWLDQNALNAGVRNSLGDGTFGLLNFWGMQLPIEFAGHAQDKKMSFVSGRASSL